MRRMATVKGHPIAPPSGRVVMSRLNLYEKIGPGPHPCNWCGGGVSWEAKRYSADSLIVDHLDWDVSNDDPGNLVASCNACNAHRRKNGHSAPIGDDEPTVLRGGNKTRAIERFCNNCGTAFWTAPAELNSGRGRFCSRSCARSGPRAHHP